MSVESLKCATENENITIPCGTASGIFITSSHILKASSTSKVHTD